MKAKTQDQLSLGPEVIQRLLPHRPPLLMVDRIERFSRAPVPTLGACRHITANEPVFAGHFPGLPLWPGVYTIEGLGQSCNLLEILVEMTQGPPAIAATAEQVLAGLRTLDAVTSLRPAPASAELGPLLEALRQPLRRMGMSAAVDLKLLAPVFAGQRLDYRVRRVLAMGDLRRFEVEAEVAGKLVARGIMDTVANVANPPHGPAVDRQGG
jgi:3-hydroxyacyl-[acyl-carrier-protein] dehydratase